MLIQLCAGAGKSAINPATQASIPIWVADYVLGSYGFGAIMAVPAHDQRDFEFAKAFDLPIQQVVEAAPDADLPITGVMHTCAYASCDKCCYQPVQPVWHLPLPNVGCFAHLSMHLLVTCSY